MKGTDKRRKKRKEEEARRKSEWIRVQREKGGREEERCRGVMRWRVKELTA